jgi:pimeloyl-ACP methyl ester carboxylesterase
MQQQFLDLNGMHISYWEVNPALVPTIFFIHGNSASAASWRKQLTSPLLKGFRLVAFDLPAHGDSAMLAPEDCHLQALAAILGEAVKALTTSAPFLISGVSLGTNLVAEMMAFNIEPAGLVLAGPCVAGGNYTIDKMMLPGTHVNVVFTDENTEADIRQYAGETSLSGVPVDLEHFLNDYNRVKSPFRSLLGQSIAEGKYSNEMALLEKAAKPLLIIFGKQEKVIDPQYLDGAPLRVWKDTIFRLEGASHLVNIDQPERFNQLLKAFAEDVC